jgi:hypothetical protein
MDKYVITLFYWGGANTKIIVYNYANFKKKEEKVDDSDRTK